MKKLAIVHRNLSDLKTGGHYYLANAIRYFSKQNIEMEIIDFGTFPEKIKKNRFFLVVHVLRRFLNQPKGIFNFTNHNLYFYLMLPYFINRIRGNKYGCGCHLSQYNLRKNSLMRWLEFFCEYLFLQGASLIIIPSKAAVHQFDVFHLGRKKRFIIKPAPNIIGHGSAPFRKNIHNLVFVGHITWRKGLDVLLKAMARLKELDLRLDIAGDFDEDSDYFKKIKRIIDENGLERTISFHGRLDPEQISNLYTQADVFVFPSRHETFGMVLVEAMSFGLPIVASAIPTTIEMVENNINGIIYETENVAALVRAIRRLTSDPNLRRSIVHNNTEITRKTRTWADVGKENLIAISPFLEGLVSRHN